jgi:hypothetical protein
MRTLTHKSHRCRGAEIRFGANRSKQNPVAAVAECDAEWSGVGRPTCPATNDSHPWSLSPAALSLQGRMDVRPRTFLAACAVLCAVLGSVPCVAQQRPVATDNSGPPATSGRTSESPQGSVVRAPNGSREPELDKAWTAYADAIKASTQALRDAINEKFLTAAKAGDLDGAKKWQAALDKFDQAGQVLDEAELRGAVNKFITAEKQGRESLARVYDEVTISLTKQLKIAEADAVRQEWRAIQRAADDGPSPKLAIHKDAIVFGQHSYYLFAEKKTQAEAQAACKKLGGHLAKLDSPEEQAFLLALAARNSPPDNSFWIDGADQVEEGRWCFIDGGLLPVDLDWGRGQPDDNQQFGGQDGLVIRVWNSYGGGKKAQLDDVNQNDKCLYLCEWPGVRSASQPLKKE